MRRIMQNEKSSPMYEALMNLQYMDRVQDCSFWPVGNARIETTTRPAGEPDGPTMRTFAVGVFTPETETACQLWARIYRDFEVDNEAVHEIAQELARRSSDS